MKYLLLFLLSATSATLSAQTVNYSEVVKVDSTSAKVLFERARTWMMNAFTDSKAVLEINDKESGQLAGKATIPATWTSLGSSGDYGTLTFNISVMVKDGRYKLEVDNYFHTYRSKQGVDMAAGLLSDHDTPDQAISIPFCGEHCQIKVWNDLQRQCSENNQTLAASLKKAMATTTSADW